MLAYPGRTFGQLYHVDEFLRAQDDVRQNELVAAKV